MDEIPHADYPHDPGYLDSCLRCSAECFCNHLPGYAPCVFCDMLQEEHDLMRERHQV